MLLIDKKYLFYLHALFLGSSLIAVNIMHSLFSQISANRDGSFPFNESEAVFIAELAKASLAFALLLVAFLKKQKTNTEANFQNVHYFNPSLRLFLEMIIPAALYTVSNILSYTAIGLLGSTGYQLFSNAKIIITALTFRIIIQTPFTIIQWTSLCLLFSALLLAKNSKYEFSLNEKDTDRLVIGISMVLVLSFASSFAGVYSEIKLKRANKHPMLQNGILYIWCCLFSLLQFNVEYILQFFDKNTHFGYQTKALLSFENFSFSVWGAIITSAVYGQIVALIFYYCDNMVKVFANSLTVIVSLFIDHVYFGKDLSIDICVSGCIVCICTVLYYIDNQILIQHDNHFMKNFKYKNSWRGGLSKLCLYFILFSFIIIIYMQLSMEGMSAKKQKKNVNSTTPLRDELNLSYSTVLPSNQKYSSNHCDWPPPLYKKAKKLQNFDKIVKNINDLKILFENNSNFSFSYIDSGQALGVYRDGVFIATDSDIDIRYAICSDCMQNEEIYTKFPPKIGMISMNNFAEWGDIWTRRTIAFNVDAAYLKTVKSDLCLQNYAGKHFYWFHKNTIQRSAFQFTYGDFWFVRLPWKGVHQINRWQEFAQTTDHTIDMWHDSWQRSLKKIETMDVNDDQTISVTELNRYLLQDGIIYERYLESISDYERCRAAAMLTFLIRFQKKPKSLKHYTKFSSNGRVDIFRFPQCDNFMTVST